MTIHTYKELIVWQKSVELAVMIYKITESFPRSELYGITSQMRRAIVSVASNIAEGRSRISKKAYVQFLTISHGSVAELETQIEITRQLSFGQRIDFSEIIDSLGSIKAMLGSMIRQLNPL